MTKHMKKYLALAAFTLTSTTALANDLYLDVSSDAFHGRIDATNSSSGINYLAEALINDDEDASVFNLGIMKTGRLNNQNVIGGLGVKFMYLDTDADSYLALALGGSLSFGFPAIPDTRLVTELFYAPSVTTTDDLDNVVDFNLRLEYQLFENGNIYGGVRLLQVENEFDVETEIDDGFFVGIKLSF